MSELHLVPLSRNGAGILNFSMNYYRNCSSFKALKEILRAFENRKRQSELDGVKDLQKNEETLYAKG